VAVDEKEFFREATLLICGSLEIEKAMSSCLKYLAEFMPVYKMFLQYYDKELGAMRVIAIATTEEGISCDVLTPLDSLVKTDVKERPISPDLNQTFIINRAESDPLSLHMLKRFQEPTNVSILGTFLMVESQRIGALILFAEGSDRYTEKDAQLFTLLREPFAIAMSNALKHRQVLRLKDLLADDCRYLQDELGRISGEKIIGADFGLKGVMEMVRQVALLASPVILFGETGTGKEVIARAIHNLSPRRKGPFIKVNCGAIPETLMDSELFGHVKGAFTGALSQKRGRFERADGGTIFLDEIGELSPEAQVRLLRVLQEKEIERVGGTQPIKVDIRVIAATHRDLQSMIKEGRFREDLFYRLQVFPISIPPLRQRMGDIPALVHHFITKKSREMGFRDISTMAMGAINRLYAYHWPGNVRELENAVERALILSRDEPLTFSDLQPLSYGDTEKPACPLDGESLNLDMAMSGHIRSVLEMTGGRVEGQGGAAELLGINPGTLRHRMRKLGIPFGRKAMKNQSKKSD
jgi:formate hydrogenlyase transcriptional activator